MPWPSIRRAAAALLVIPGLMLAGCTGSTTAGRAQSLVASPSASASSSVASPSASAASPTTASPPASASSSVSSSTSPFPTTLTPEGLWWGVDSTVPIGPAALDNVHDFYAGHHTPTVWGRYIDGNYALQSGELAFARKHGIYVYVLVPDSDCSVCSGGHDICGNDRYASQARSDATEAIAAAKRAKLPPGTTLFKDVEQIGTCTGELTASYLETWYRTVRKTEYRAGFYGNAYSQKYDFVRAYCEVIKADPQLGLEVPLADDEPEPAIGAHRGKIGPGNAPHFKPDVPHCQRPGTTKIWQYGESLTYDNSTDVDEVAPDTPGLIAPDGTATP